MTQPEETEQAPARLHCVVCGEEIDECEFCDEADCPKALCFGCVILALRETATPLHKR